MGANISTVGDTQATLDAIRQIVQALREASRWSERNVGLTSAQLFVLQTLAETPGMSINDLAARTHTHQSSVSTVVTRLVESGLALRSPSGADGRSVTVTLSGLGRRTAARAPEGPQGRLIRAIEQLPAARRSQLASALTDVASAMHADAADAHDHVPAMFFEERRHARRRTRHE